MGQAAAINDQERTRGNSQTLKISVAVALTIIELLTFVDVLENKEN